MQGEQSIAIFGQTWQLATLDGRTVSPLEAMGTRPTRPELVFSEEGRASGFSGVNRMFAQMDAAALRAGKTDFSKTGMTMMAGPPAAMDLERRFGEALSRAATWSISGSTLTLRDQRGGSVATFKAGPSASQ